MNIQEMNGNGPKLWIFWLVSICVSGTTLVIWTSVKRVTDYLKHNRRVPSYGLKTYLFYGALILRFGLLGWTIRRGLMLNIITGGHFGSESMNLAGEIEFKVKPKLGLHWNVPLWPPPPGFNKMYFRTKPSSQTR